MRFGTKALHISRSVMSVVRTLIAIAFVITLTVCAAAQTKRHRRRPAVGRAPFVPSGCVIMPPLDGGSLDGKELESSAPVYPAGVREKRISGSVVVEVLVDEKGLVSSARALRGPYLLHQAAVEAARRTRFPVTSLSDRPVQVKGLLTYKFEL
jgi:TonB family protein